MLDDVLRRSLAGFLNAPDASVKEPAATGDRSHIAKPKDGFGRIRWYGTVDRGLQLRTFDLSD